MTTWMDLEDIMLSEIRVRERQIPYDFTYVWNLKNKTKEQTKQKSTHSYREQTGGYQSRRVLGGM